MARRSILVKKKIKEIRGERSVIEDQAGQTRMYLGVEANGVVTINLYGTQQACLTACIDIDGNPKIGLFNKQGNSVLSVGISDEIGQGVQISNAAGVPVCFIQVPGDGIRASNYWK